MLFMSKEMAVSNKSMVCRGRESSYDFDGTDVSIHIEKAGDEAFHVPLVVLCPWDSAEQRAIHLSGGSR